VHYGPWIWALNIKRYLIGAERLCLLADKLDFRARVLG
jgi:hypothetical protein